MYSYILLDCNLAFCGGGRGGDGYGWGENKMFYLKAKKEIYRNDGLGTGVTQLPKHLRLNCI